MLCVDEVHPVRYIRRHLDPFLIGLRQFTITSTKSSIDSCSVITYNVMNCDRFGESSFYTRIVNVFGVTLQLILLIGSDYNSDCW